LKHYFITGGCGFIGSHLVDSLLADGHSVTVLDDLSSGQRSHLDPRATLVVGDVADSGLVKKCMEKADGCFHLAAIASVVRSNEHWLETHRTNLTGSITVFDAARARDSTATIPVVYASSAAVYGNAFEVPLLETMPLRPLTAYGADKLGSEVHAQVAWSVHRVPSTGLRFFNVYGPRQTPQSPYSGVISIFVERIAMQQPVTIHGDGLQVRDFIYVSDVVTALRAAMDRTIKDANVYNVCTGRATSILDLQQQVANCLNIPAITIYGPPRLGDIRQSIGSPMASIAALGVTAHITVANGLSHLIAATARK